MNREIKSAALILGLCLVLALGIFGYCIDSAVVHFKEYERTVTVKGLSEREVPANIVIWPVSYSAASNELQGLYVALENNSKLVRDFLLAQGISAQDITLAVPVITDKSAQQYGGERGEFRYVGQQTITVYSAQVDVVRKAMTELAGLGKQGIAFSGDEYQNEYIFTGLNSLKPQMIEEATTQAREVALKFAKDSSSQLGKIRQASQGQFSIEARDKNNPHIKKVRVVSTVEYYLSD